MNQLHQKAARLHQRERMRAWAQFCAAMMPEPAPHPERDADSMLAEFDKRFPPPSAESQSSIAPGPASRVIQAETALSFIRSCAVNGTLPSWLLDGKDIALVKGFAAVDAELASLREKARLWDALESARVRVTHQFDGTWTVDHDAMPVAPRYETLREAVQAAIDAGALK